MEMPQTLPEHADSERIRSRPRPHDPQQRLIPAQACRSPLPPATGRSRSHPVPGPSISPHRRTCTREAARLATPPRYSGGCRAPQPAGGAPSRPAQIALRRFCGERLEQLGLEVDQTVAEHGIADRNRDLLATPYREAAAYAQCPWAPFARPRRRMSPKKGAGRILAVDLGDLVELALGTRPLIAPQRCRSIAARRRL